MGFSIVTAEITSDFQKVESLLRRSISESPYASFALDYDNLGTVTSQFCVGFQPTHTLLLAIIDDKPVGFLAGVAIDSHPFIRTKRMASEVALYIEPEYRTLGLSKPLVEAFEDWARKAECPLITMTSMTNNYEKAMDKLFTSQGYHKSETSYLKELK